MKTDKFNAKHFIREKFSWIVRFYDALRPAKRHRFFRKIAEEVKAVLRKAIYGLFVFFRAKNKSADKIKTIFRAKIYDCFIFFNEFEVLEIRLNTLYPYVDHFILVEATTTHSGKPKPLYYKENAHRFEKFKDKIIHIVVDDMPPIDHSMDIWSPQLWEIYRATGDYKIPHLRRMMLQFYQRDQIKRGLSNCNPQDIILVSDIDEISNPEKLGEMIVSLNTVAKLVAFQQRMYYYRLNGFWSDRWRGTKACKFSTFSKDLESSAQQLRSFEPIRDIIKRGGWHFSYLGSIEQIIYKISSFANVRYDYDKIKDKEKLLERMLEGKDPLYRKAKRHRTIQYQTIDKSYPSYLIENVDKYRDLIRKV